MRSFYVLLALTVVIALPAAAQRVQPKRLSDQKLYLAPYVPSPPQIVEQMLSAARLQPGETLYDLGSGDGRVLIAAAQKFKAKAVGVELSEPLVKVANQRIQELNLQDQAKVIHGNLLEVDLSGADVVTIYLLTLSNDQLKPNLEKYLKPGARVVSHDFEVRGWKPVRTETAEFKGRVHHIYVYEMPGPK